MAYIFALSIYIKKFRLNKFKKTTYKYIWDRNIRQFDKLQKINLLYL